MERSITNNIVLQKQREGVLTPSTENKRDLEVSLFVNESKSSIPKQKQTETEIAKQIHQSKVQASFFQQSERLR